jgi:hypothetical protein
MTQRLDEKLKAARIVLENLSNGPMRWTPLVKAALRGSPTPWKFQTIMHWLLVQGYVERIGRGVYGITDKGRALLGSLT